MTTLDRETSLLRDARESPLVDGSIPARPTKFVTPKFNRS
jgi:hypothetical protein